MRWKRNTELVYRDEDEDGGLLFDPDVDDCYGLNLTAKAVWEHIEEINAGDYSFMREIFDDVPNDEQLKVDVVELLKELAEVKAIIPAEE